MAHFLRGKQAGVQNDFSANVTPDLFALDDLRRYGISAQITELAYDPVQSLLAAGTARSNAGVAGQIYVFGGGDNAERVTHVFQLPSTRASVKTLQFCSDKLLCLDDKNDLNIFSLATKKLTVSYSPPGAVSAMASDPTLDYAILGLQSVPATRDGLLTMVGIGELIAFDVDREALAPFRIPCLWGDFDARAKHVPVVSLEFHPRDIGKLLIGYLEGAVTFSFKQNEPRKFFQYHLQRGAPGGDSDPALMSMERRPKVTQAIWHPTGTFIMTGHEDSSTVIWDAKEGRIISARTATDTNIDRPQPIHARPSDAGRFAPKTPIRKISWCCKQDPDDTGVLIAGGLSTDTPMQGLTFMELGRTPNYTTTPWAQFTSHFENPKTQKILPTPPQVEVVNFCLIPRSSPWYAGAQEPVAILALLSSGEIITMAFPTGTPLSPTNKLPLDLSFVHPFITCLAQSSVERGRWLGLTERRRSGPTLFEGGIEAPHNPQRHRERNIVQTAHADGTIRLWDAGHADDIENKFVLQADVARAIGRYDNLQVTSVSFSGASGELAAGLASGELIIFRWNRNSRPGVDSPSTSSNRPRELTDVSDRKDPTLVEGLHPFTLLDQQEGAVTAIKVSDVGFVAAGFANGSIIVINMRGPEIILTASIADFLQPSKAGRFRRHSEAPQRTHPTSIEFSVMSAEGDGYSSILLHVGTSAGHIVTFKLLPQSRTQYKVAYVGFTALEGSVMAILPLSATSGKPAYASQSAVASLPQGFKVDGVLIGVTKTEARMFRPASAKGAHKAWESAMCDSIALAECLDYGMALVGLFGDGTAKAFTLPGLREIASTRIDHILNVKAFGDAVVTTSGEIIGWCGPSEVALVNIWGSGESYVTSQDRIFDSEKLIPPRPTISNFQWVSGTQYITPIDMDILIGGSDRPPSARMLAQARSDEATRRSANRSAASAAGSSKDAGSEEGYWAYMQRQLNERTEKLGLVGDSMDRLENNSSGFAEDVNKFVSRQKRNFVMGAVKSKFGM
ncbi:MAG: hypothetical protein M1828_003853 [Chrysothrix sp. TS-e1954]|nr:MAG: hypothetical protein M1828_003853 [Chrysothrix sp. TS-e1954]